MYCDWDSLFERFCIMTVDGKLSDEDAILRLKNETTKPLINKLIEFSKNYNNLNGVK